MMKSEPQQPRKIRVGDRVRVPYVRGTISGVVIEDLGPMSKSSRRLMRVEVPQDPDEPAVRLVFDDELALEPPSEPVPLEKDKVMEFLKLGGLIAILKPPENGKKEQRCVWLSRGTLGGITYTFNPDRGILGGVGIPYMMLHENIKIFAKEVERVVAFLKHFDLTEEEARDVIKAVGVVPDSRHPQRRRHSG